MIEELRLRVGDPRTANDAGRSESSLLPLPPVETVRIRDVERQLAFSLPPLLTEIYCKVCNGGVGPGYGSFRIHETPQTGDLVETYEYISEPEGRWRWPDGLLPVFAHGCGIYECVDCTSESFPVIYHDPHYLVRRSVPTSLAPLCDSLATRLNHWLAGDDLITAAKAMLQQKHDQKTKGR